MNMSIAQPQRISYIVYHKAREITKMKNITVSVDDETYRLANVKAKAAGTSVSGLVRSYLVSLGQGETIENRFDHLRSLQDKTLEAIRARGGGLRAVDNLTRRELHERDALR